MADDDAKRLIERLLENYTPGSLLHLLGAVLLADASEEMKDSDPQRHERLKVAENALFVFGLGLDSSVAE